MPELPDVEAIRRYLLPKLKGRTISAVSTTWERAVQEPSPAQLKRRVAGQCIADILRRAKFLCFKLSGGEPLILHLGMTGSLIVEPASATPRRFAHHTFSLDSGDELRFIDPRKLGKLWLVKDEAPVLGDLGPEPLEPSFTPAVLGKALARNAPVKALLMDQAVVAGLGNIYADETLFAAGIHPLTLGAELTPAQVKRLHQAIRKVLPRATTLLEKVLPVESPPTESDLSQGVLLMPREAGAACTRCRAKVQRIVLRGRSTYLCPREQKR